MANLRILYIDPIKGSTSFLSEDTDVDFNSIAIGPDKLKLSQTGTGVDARISTNGVRLSVPVGTEPDDPVTLGQLTTFGLPYFTKKYKNTSGAPIAQGKVVAFEDDGSISLADADVIELSDVAGVTAESIPNGSFGSVYKIGEVSGVLSALDAKNGDTVYLSGTAGEMTLTVPDTVQTIIVLGTAELPTETEPTTTTGSASSLYLNPRILSY